MVSRSLGVICYNDAFLERVTKLLQGLVSWTRSLPFCFWSILNSMNYGHITKKMQNTWLSKTLIYEYLRSSFELCWMWIFPCIKLFWHSCSMWKKLGWLNFSVRSYLPLIRKDCFTHMHSLAVYVKEGLPFALDLSFENRRFLIMVPTGFTSFIVFLLFPLSITCFILMYSFWCCFI